MTITPRPELLEVLTYAEQRAWDCFHFQLSPDLAWTVAEAAILRQRPVDDYLLALNACGPGGRAEIHSMADLIAWEKEYAKTYRAAGDALWLAAFDFRRAILDEIPQWLRVLPSAWLLWENWRDHIVAFLSPRIFVLLWGACAIGAAILIAWIVRLARALP